jgi:probable rRNA maturation factor
VKRSQGKIRVKIKRRTAPQAPTTRPKLPSWRVHCTIESRALRIPVQRIRAIARSVLAEVSQEIAIPDVHQLHIMVINDARMREINFAFRKKDKPTDVLSFPLYTPREIRGLAPLKEAAGDYLGDLVISSETTLRQASRFGVSVEAELIRLIVHGILHLIGYDHEGVPAREAQKMRRRERGLRGIVGVKARKLNSSS